MRREEPEPAWTRISSLAAWLQSKFDDVAVFKAALPAVASEELLSLADQEAEGQRIPLANFAQVGIGIVHLCALQDTLDANLVNFAVRLRKAAEYLGGTLVIEHCPAELKNHVDVWGSGGNDSGAMRKMKLAWDPKEILSPGRLLGF